jgi:hypothetical protein
MPADLLSLFLPFSSCRLKALVYVLVSRFEFLPDPEYEIKRWAFITTRPYAVRVKLGGEGKDGQEKEEDKDLHPTTSLPMLVKLYERS